MKLGEYLSKQKVDTSHFADQLGVSAEAVRLWVNGRRVPNKESMAAIVKATAGEVQPNDFYRAA